MPENKTQRDQNYDLTAPHLGLYSEKTINEKVHAQNVHCCTASVTESQFVLLTTDRPMNLREEGLRQGRDFNRGAG